MSYFPHQKSVNVYVQAGVPSTMVAWTNQPAATTELYGTTRRRSFVCLTPYTECRLYAWVDVIANAGALLAAQYSLDDGTTWVYLDGSADGALTTQEPQIAIDALNVAVSGWITMDAAAAADEVLLRCVGVGGNGAIDPALTHVVAEFR